MEEHPDRPTPHETSPFAWEWSDQPWGCNILSPLMYPWILRFMNEGLARAITRRAAALATQGKA
jgi:hypothetical protein